jgi:hypothetical protein
MTCVFDPALAGAMFAHPLDQKVKAMRRRNQWIGCALCVLLSASIGCGSGLPGPKTADGAQAVMSVPGTLTVTPNPATLGSTLTFSACGLLPSTGTTIVVSSPCAISWFGGPTDANGCYDSTPYEVFHATCPGTSTVKAWQRNAHGKSVLMAETTFTVQ